MQRTGIVKNINQIRTFLYKNFVAAVSDIDIHKACVYNSTYKSTSDNVSQYKLVYSAHELYKFRYTFTFFDIFK